MNACLCRRLPAALLAVICAGLAAAGATTCQAAGDASPVPSRAQQALDKATQLEGFLQQLQQQRQSQPAREPRHTINSFEDLQAVWDRVWKDLNSLCPNGALEIDLSSPQGQSRLRGFDEEDGTRDADGF